MGVKVDAFAEWAAGAHAQEAEPARHGGGHVKGARSVAQLAVAQLAEAVVSPASTGATGCEGAGEAKADAYGRKPQTPYDRHRRRGAIKESVTELAKGAVAQQYAAPLVVTPHV